MWRHASPTRVRHRPVTPGKAVLKSFLICKWRTTVLESSNPPPLTVVCSCPAAVSSLEFCGLFFVTSGWLAVLGVCAWIHFWVLQERTASWSCCFERLAAPAVIADLQPVGPMAAGRRRCAGGPLSRGLPQASLCCSARLRSCMDCGLGIVDTGKRHLPRRPFSG